MKKPSFLERLTGSVNFDELDDEFETMDEDGSTPAVTDSDQGHWSSEATEPPKEEGELPIDMYQTGDSIVIRALVAGVNPDDLDIAITRDMVTIKGHRDEEQEAPDENYFHRELYWGGFSRSILLPEEVTIDEAEAKERHGFLEIVLPKVDKDRSARLKVKVGGK